MHEFIAKNIFDYMSIPLNACDPCKTLNPHCDPIQMYNILKSTLHGGVYITIKLTDCLWFSRSFQRIFLPRIYFEPPSWPHPDSLGVTCEQT